MRSIDLWVWLSIYIYFIPLYPPLSEYEFSRYQPYLTLFFQARLLKPASITQSRESLYRALTLSCCNACCKPCIPSSSSITFSTKVWSLLPRASDAEAQKHSFPVHRLISIRKLSPSQHLITVLDLQDFCILHHRKASKGREAREGRDADNRWHLTIF